MSSHHRFKDDLALVSGRQAVLPGKLAKLLMTQTHDSG